MKFPGQTICLSMIVKNEASVIRRCLESVKPIIDHWVIVDTGSSDGTQDVIRSCMADIPGTLYERKWQDFASNRTEALKLARPHADFSLVIDADDYLTYPDGYKLPFLTDDCYMLNISDIELLYPRLQIFSNKRPWYYRGVLHEFPTIEGPHKLGTLPIIMVRNHDGARRKDPRAFHRDAELLEKALRTETDDFLRRRYTFYLAQSYRDCGALEKAVEAYLERSRMGGWEEEVFYSLYQAGKLKERLQCAPDDVLQTYQEAILALPRRVEARHAASRFCRIHQRFQEGYDFAKPGLGQPYIEGTLFGEPWIYRYGLWDEFAVNAYWINQFDECLEVSLRLLKEDALPVSERGRVLNNASEAAREMRQKSDRLRWRPGPQFHRSSHTREIHLRDALALTEQIQCLDIGAAAINEQTKFHQLIELGFAHLNAFEGDARQIDALRALYKDNVTIFDQFLFDGSEQTVYLATPASGMTSLLRPKQAALQFFNHFEHFGRVEREARISTARLDDVEALPKIDVAKLDIQGAELCVLRNGEDKLADCLAIQLEVSFINLYERQPSFGEVDIWMRQKGFVPHCFAELKRWSIAPTIFENNFRVPGNQLLEADVIYIRDPLNLDALSSLQIKKLALLAHHAFESVDLCVFLLRELERRGAVERGFSVQYTKSAAAA